MKSITMPALKFLAVPRTVLLVACALLASAASSVLAAAQTYTTIDYPSSPGRVAADISVKWGQRK